MGLKLIGEVALDGSGFQRGLAGLQKGLGGFKNTLATVFGSLAIGNLVKGTIEWAGTLTDVSDALGVSVEWLQKMQNGATLSGGKIEDVEKSLVALNLAREDALRKPGGENAKAFERMGFSRSDIAALPAEQFYDRMVSLFADGGSAQLENDVIQVGGKSAKNLLAAFHNQFASDSPIVSAELIAQLDDLGDTFASLQQTLTTDLAPAIVWVVEKLSEFVNWIKMVGSVMGGAVEGLRKLGPGEILKSALTGAVGMNSLYDKVFSGDEAGQAALDETKRQDADAETKKKAMEERKALREERRNRAPFDADKIKAQELAYDKARPKEPKMATDALLTVGNFLGSNSGIINSIAEQHLQTAQSHLAVAQAHTALLGTIADKLGAGGADSLAGLDIP